MKVALITGGSRGLGKSMALHLAKKHHHVVLTYKRSKEQAEAVVNEIKTNGGEAMALQLDTTEMNSFERFVADLKSSLDSAWGSKGIDVLVNNAGIGIHVPMQETTMEQFDRLINIHLKGPFFLTQLLLPMIKEGGNIINISSGLTRFCFPGYGAYAMMKGAVAVMSRYLAKELGDRKIRVNTLAPGAIETDFGEGVVRDNPEINQFIASQTALGRVGLPDDIGSALASIASDECAWINGQRIEVSGGMFL